MGVLALVRKCMGHSVGVFLVLEHMVENLILAKMELELGQSTVLGIFETCKCCSLG